MSENKISKDGNEDWKDLFVNARYEYLEKKKILRIIIRIETGTIKQNYIYNFDIKKLIEKIIK